MGPGDADRAAGRAGVPERLGGRSVGPSGSSAATRLVAIAAVLLGGLLAGGCAVTPPLPPTIRVVGLVEPVAGDALPPDAVLEVRLERADAVVDRVELPPPVGEDPARFELLVDRDMAGGLAVVRGEVRAGGRLLMATLEPPSVPLDAAPPPVVLRLASPRRAVGP